MRKRRSLKILKKTIQNKYFLLHTRTNTSQTVNKRRYNRRLGNNFLRKPFCPKLFIHYIYKKFNKELGI